MVAYLFYNEVKQKEILQSGMHYRPIDPSKCQWTNTNQAFHVFHSAFCVIQRSRLSRNL